MSDAEVETDELVGSGSFLALAVRTRPHCRVRSHRAHAGKVAVSELGRSPHTERLCWTRAAVDDKLQAIMHEIQAKYGECGPRDGAHPTDDVRGVNLVGFLRVADGMPAYGVG